MGTNVNELLRELEYIKALLTNKELLSLQLSGAEQRAKERKKEAVQKGIEEEKALYGEKSKKIAKTPFPSVKVDEQKNAPQHPDLSPAVRGRLIPKVKYVDYVKEYTVTTFLYLAVFVFAGLFLIGIPVFWIFDTFVLTLLGIFGFSTVLPVCFLISFVRKSKKQDVFYDQKQVDNLEEYAKWQEKEAAWEAEIKAYINGLDIDSYKEPVESVFGQTKQYTAEFCELVADFDKDAAPIYANYSSALRESKAVAKSEMDMIEQKILQNNAAINAVTLIHPDMFGRIDKISAALSHGRADSIKEAINIVLDDERRAAEEAQRQLEAERQLEIQQRRAAEEREEARRAAAEAKKQANAELTARQTAARNRCMNCYYNISVSSSQQCTWRVRNDFEKSGDVCPRYRPKSR